MRGASATMASVMPVSTWMNAGIGPRGVDQGLELAEHLAAAHLDGADLGDRRVGGAAARGLEVDDDERDIGQCGAQVVEGALDHLHVPDRMPVV